MSLARHSEDDHAKVRESVDKLAMSKEDDHAKVSAIVDKGLAQLMQWLDIRLQQQEDNLRSLIIAQERQRIQESVKMEPQETSTEQALKPGSSTSNLSSQRLGMALDDKAHTQTGAQRQGMALDEQAQAHTESGAQRQAPTSYSGTNSEMPTPRSEMPTPRVESGTHWMSILCGIFDELDLNGTGCLDIAEFHKAVKETGFSAVDALAVFGSIDKSQNGVIDRSEWIQMVSQSEGGSKGEMELINDFLSRLVELQRTRGYIYVKADRTRPHMILRHDSFWRVVWDVMLMVLLFYVSVSVPFSIGYGKRTVLRGIDFVVDIVFCFDVVLNFRTSYTDTNDIVVLDWKRIGTSYLQSWFVLDFISSFPFDIITDGLVPNLSVGRLLKMVNIAKVLKFLRVSKLSRLHSNAEWTEWMEIALSSIFFDRLMRISKLLVIAFLVAHWLACFNSAVDKSAFNEYFDALGLEPTVLEEYLAGMYWAMTTISTVGYGDITPVTDQERAFAMLAMVVGGALYGFVVGSVTSIVQNMDLHVNAYNERLQVIQSWLKRHKRIPKLMRRQLHRLFKRKLLTRTVISDDSVIDQLSGELRGDVAFFIIDEHVRHHPMLVDLPNSALAKLVYVLQENEAKRHELIVQIADPGIGMYFLVEGLACYGEGLKWHPPGATHQHKKFQHITTGESFGEEIIFGFAEKYAYTVIAVVDCKFNWIDQKHFQEHFATFPELRNQMYAAVVHPRVSSQANVSSSSLPASSSNKTEMALVNL